MLDQNEQQLKQEVSGYMNKSWKWLMFIGLLTLVLGIIGVGMNVTMTIVSILFVGGFVFFSGWARLFEAVMVEGWKNKLLTGLTGVLYLVAAILMFIYPAASAAWFTLFIAGFFIAVGIFRLGLGFQLRKEVKGWFWTVLSGITSIVLGVLIYAEWPVSGLWVIGLYVSIELILQGISTMTVALAVKDLRKELKASS